MAGSGSGKAKMKIKTKRILLIICLVWLLPTISTALYQPIGIVKTLIQAQFATVFNKTYDIATPSGDDSPSFADDEMRLTKAALQERLAVEHRFALTGTEVSAADTGEHTDITTDSIVNAGTMTNAGTLDVTGDLAVNTDKFKVTAASGNTSVAGTLDVVGNIDPTSYETTNGGFLDEDNLASDAADKVASQQSIKAYVDTEITAISVKAWVTFDGSNADPDSTKTGFNITSITDNGTGDYTINWDTDFASAAYAVVVTAGDTGAGGAPKNARIRVQSAGSVRVIISDLSHDPVDAAIINVIAIGTQ